MGSKLTARTLAIVKTFGELTNLRSIRVMERIGMRRDLEGHFEHPSVEEPSFVQLAQKAYRLKSTPVSF